MPGPIGLARGAGRRSILLLVAIVFLLAACSSAANLSTVGSAVDQGNRSGGGAPEVPGANLGGGNGFSNDQQPQLYDVSRPDLMVIKTGSYSLQVASLDAALSSAAEKIGALGGYAAGSERQGDDDQASATVVYRIPAARWDEAITALRGLSIKVVSESSQTEDVTGQVLDLGAQITNLQASERALQAIMTKAEKIADVLAVQAELSKTQGQIEQLTAQKKHLTEQAAFSTATVTYQLKPEAAVITTSKEFDPANEIDRASANLVQVLQGVATAGIWFGIVWLPILLIMSIIGLIAWAVFRRVRGSNRGPGPVVPTVSEG
jgi:hypothetical protein